MIGFDLAALAPGASSASGASSTAGTTSAEGEAPGGFLEVLAGFVAGLDPKAGSDGRDTGAGDPDAGADAETVAGTLVDGEVPEAVLLDVARWLSHAGLRDAGHEVDADAGHASEELLAELQELEGDLAESLAGVAEAPVRLAALRAAVAVHAAVTDGSGEVDVDVEVLVEDAEPVAHPASSRSTTAGGLLSGTAATGVDDADVVGDDVVEMGQDLAEDVAGERGRVEVDEVRSAGTSRPPGEVGGPAPSATSPTPPTETRDPSGLRPGLAATIERLIEASTRLEQMPPPRSLVLELGEMRVRLSLDEAGLRLQLLGDQQADRDLLQEAGEELRARGFDLTQEHGDGASDGPSTDEHQTTHGDGDAPTGRPSAPGMTAAPTSTSAAADTALRL
jgi:hypothetical protein